jgi:hypothetical protein
MSLGEAPMNPRARPLVEEYGPKGKDLAEINFLCPLWPSVHRPRQVSLISPAPSETMTARFRLGEE